MNSPTLPSRSSGDAPSALSKKASVERKRLRLVKEANARIELAGYRAQIADRLTVGTAVADAPEPEEHLSGRLEPRFGCQPYGAHREGATRTVQVTLTTGEVATIPVCATCGSGATRDGKDYLDKGSYCEACQRSHRDGEIAKLKGE